jgi:hypothetical protein
VLCFLPAGLRGGIFLFDQPLRFPPAAPLPNFGAVGVPRHRDVRLHPQPDPIGQSLRYLRNYGVNHESKLGDLDGDGRVDVLGKPHSFEAPLLHVWLQK